MKRNAFGARAAALIGFLALPMLVSLSFSLACSDRSKPVDVAPPAAVLLDPIPAPAGLLAEITIPSPETTWKELRPTIGGPALFIPQTIGGFMASVLGLPITIAGEVDGNLPALGAIIDAPERPQPYVAIGVHVRVGERFVDQLTKGEAARFTARVDPATGITAIEAKGTVKGPVAMGVLGNYLLVGRELADLTAVGPYIARTLAKSPASAKEDIAIDVPDAALAGPVKQAMQRIRDRLKGSNAANVPLLPLDRIAEAALEIVPDLARARITIDLDGPTARVRLEGAPRAGEGPARIALRDMKAGDVAPLRALPDGTLVGVLDRLSAGAGVPLVRGMTEAERLLPAASSKLEKEDREAILAALRAISDARGDWLSGGMSFGSTGPLAYVRSPAPDQEKLSKAMKDLLALLKRASVEAWLKDEGFVIKVGKAVLEGVPGDAQRVTIARIDEGEKDGGKPAKGAGKDAKPKPDAKGSKDGKDGKSATAPKDDKAAAGVPPGDVPTSIDIVYLVRKDGLFAAAGYGAKDGLSNLIAAEGAAGGSFGAAPEIKSALDALGGDVAFTLIADPLRLIASRAGKPGAALSAPVVLALGRSSGGAGGSPEQLWIRADVAVTVIQELVKHRGALSL